MVTVVHRASARAPAEITGFLAQAFDYLGDVDLDRNERRRLRELARDCHAHSLALAQGGRVPTEPPRRPQGPGRSR